MLNSSNWSKGKFAGFFSYWTDGNRWEKYLIFLFLLTTPLIHARVRGDGAGYYAYVRSPLVDHNFQFASDWENPSEELMTVYLDGRFVENPLTKTGHLPNFYAVGPAILWLPFLAVTHVLVLGLNGAGFHIVADGHSWPYLVTMAGATAIYSLLGLCLAFRLAKVYVEECWAFLATVAVWLATSLPLYIYGDPSWSHALSAFCASWFLWYWQRTRAETHIRYKIILGLLAGLLVDVYLPNAVFLAAPALDSIGAYLRWLKGKPRDQKTFIRQFSQDTGFVFAAVFAFCPTLIARLIVFGNPFDTGVYTHVAWNWKSPVFLQVLFSSNHGLLLSTPILTLAIVGLFFLCRRSPNDGPKYLAIAVAFYWLISSYPWWHGVFGVGNRFFVSLTPIFILGLATFFSYFARLWSNSRSAAYRMVPLVVFFVIWNLGLIYQFSTHLMPNRGQVFWREIIYNQFRIVPEEIFHSCLDALQNKFK